MVVGFNKSKRKRKHVHMWVFAILDSYISQYNKTLDGI